MKSAPSRCVRACEHGLSLVELMVALAIGLFIVLIATTIYVQGLSNFSFRMGQSENLGNSRYTLDTLNSELSKAGYRRDPLQEYTDAFPADAQPHANGCRFANGQALYAPDERTLCMRFQARDAAETDCAGTSANLGTLKPYEAPVPGAGLLVERYAVQDGALVCQAAGQGIAVADGVRGVRFEFGVDQQGDSSAMRRVDQFKTAVPEAGESIRSLRYAVLLASSGQGLAQGMDSTVCGRWAELGGAAADCDTSRGQLYQLVTGSLTLRNLMP
ncbi:MULTISPECIES: prepilin-type N-terminal cleavage/methylation domain-containing protein [Delftia]|uniref:Prepilin-type N-terminal cleavage/methylation domain-containing protein n=1 Tax=Delftia acidovorans TaxID=80866 RepID=A0A7T2S702_DELAC|nr:MULTISPECIES: prepilin-type N-terminal cleavage/methylation domain-containing protein [Delftia]MBB1649864.1 pilus assembly protein PilW [Delftia sp. UME58]QPS10099.1 prepilin-type N-terminal cleavage/methylation domain-containing protein [Delftia acidovorans]